MRILQVTRQFFPSVGGIENVVYGLVQALIKLNHHVDVVTLRLIFSTGKLADLEDDVDGIHIKRLSHVGLKRYPIAFSIWSCIFSYDVLHIHAIDFFVDFVSLTRFVHRKPIVVTTHGGIFHTKWLLPLKKLYFQTFTRLSLVGVDAVVCISQHDYDLFRTIVPESKLHTIVNGVNVESFLSVEKSIETGLLVGIGRIAENKEIARLIQLLPMIKAEFSDVNLVWIGGDPLGKKSELYELANQLGVASSVHLLGNVSIEEMQKLLSKAHLFVSAASYEAFGLSTIEAMSSATVPVVTSVGIHPEVIIEGKTGFIYQFNEEEAIDCFRKVLSLNEEQIQQIGSNAREIARQYSWNKVVNSYLKIYQSVLSKQPG
jgi:alpha-1,3-mannosyltransferase